jgi:hypothetical protein
MTRPQVYGQQIVVKLYDEQRTAPFVVDFNKISFDNKVRSESYRTISKSVTTHQPMLDGYNIQLTRNKRDNHLMQLMALLYRWNSTRMRFTEFTVERITTHNYTANSIDLKSEFAPRTLGSQSIIETGLKIVTQELRAITTSAIKSGVAELKKNNEVFNVVEKRVSEGIQTASNISAMVRGYTNYPIVERTVWLGCTLAGNDGSDEPNNESMESLSLNASSIVDESDPTQVMSYFDRLLIQNQANLTKEQSASIIKKIGNELLNNFTPYNQASRTLQNELDRGPNITSIMEKVAYNLFN